VKKKGLSVEELAQSARVHPDGLLELLEEDVQRGVLVRHADGSFQLSRFAEEEYGSALRQLNSWKE
jgi:uncharacterized protein with von Willebrand factor type A (vWA) domain